MVTQFMFFYAESCLHDSSEEAEATQQKQH